MALPDVPGERLLAWVKATFVGAGPSAAAPRVPLMLAPGWGSAAPAWRCASLGPRLHCFPGAGRRAEFRCPPRRFCPGCKAARPPRSDRWKALLEAHPEALHLPCDIAKTETVAGLLQHIVAVEVRYAERLSGQAETAYEAVPSDSVAALYATHERAMRLYGALAAQDAAWWAESLRFSTRSAGEMSAPRSAVFAHALLHAIRHYAQLATLVRQHGIKPDWPMDYLFLHASR